MKVSNYTNLVHAGEGITIDKGVISATGGGGGSSNIVIIAKYDNDLNKYNIDLTWSELVAGIANGNILFC